MSLKRTLEALLFATDQPLTLGRLQEVLPEVERSAIQAALQELEQEYDADQRAFRVARVAGGWQLATRSEYADMVRRLFVGKRRVRLTKPALEALAIIAYKQPTTRPEVDAIRGVSSGGVLETLLERNLVGIAGRADGVGRPLLYATTPEFLQYLGLNDLKDLPSLAELEGMLAEREAEMRRQEEDEMRELAAAGAPPDATARLEAPPQEVASLEELDAELQERGAAIRDVAARVAAFDAPETEADDAPADPAVTDEVREERADNPNP